MDRGRRCILKQELSGLIENLWKNRQKPLASRGEARERLLKKENSGVSLVIEQNSERLVYNFIKFHKCCNYTIKFFDKIIC